MHSKFLNVYSKAWVHCVMCIYTLQHFHFLFQEREVTGVAMYETVDPSSSTHIPAPYEEVGVVTEVKSSRDIQLTANEA